MKNREYREIPQDVLISDADLCKRVAEGDAAAAEEFYEKYHRLAEYFGRMAASRCRSGVVDEEDISHDMFMHMLQRTNKYDSQRKASFAGFASLYASQRVDQFTDEAQYSVRLPQHIRKIVNQVQRINSDLASRRQPFLSDEDIAERFGVTLESDSSKLNVADIRRAIMLTSQMGSIDNGFSPEELHTDDHPFSFDGRLELTMVGAEETKSPEDEVMAMALKEDIEKMLGTLGDREAEVLRLRFGIGEEFEWSLAEVGRRFGVTPERIRQIETKAISKLGMPRPRRYLAPHRRK